MTFYLPPWENDQEPNQTNLRQWLDNLYTRFQPIEQARWNQSNIDSLFYAGEHSFVNRYYNFSPQTSWQNFHFNIIQQPLNMVTGYQRQHRKSISYYPVDGADPHTCSQYTKIIKHVNNDSRANILSQFSRACELSAVSGMCLVQPYLDYIDDPAQGSLRLKVWEYNSFLIDPYFREPDMSDAQFIWCQQYVSKQEAQSIFPDRAPIIRMMAGTPQRYGRFYFLPENYNMARNDLLVMSYVWYKWRRKKKRLYNRETEQIFDFSEDDQIAQEILANMPMVEIIEMEVPTWKLAVVLNDEIMFQGNNPLKFDSCPFVNIFWNYNPELSYYDLRVRSLVRSLRDAQFLLNRRIILNHDISESSINSGYIRKEGAVINEENLRKAGQGYDIILDASYEMTDIQKIIPNAVPPSDLQLADQLVDLIYRISGVNQELLGMSQEKGLAGITQMLRQGAGLVTLQKYFDQWDTSLKLIGDLELQIILNNWNVSKVALMIGEEPSPHFFSKIFAKYKVVVAEGLDTITQQQEQFAQALELNAALGGVLPPSWLASRATIQGKEELVQLLQQQEQSQAAQQQHLQMVQGAVEEAKLKELYSKAVANIAMARERDGRKDSNVGLFEERLSEISNNRSMAIKNKTEALAKLVEVIQKYGELEAQLQQGTLQQMNMQQVFEEDIEKKDAQRQSIANDFTTQILAGMGGSFGNRLVG